MAIKVKCPNCDILNPVDSENTGIEIKDTNKGLFYFIWFTCPNCKTVCDKLLPVRHSPLSLKLGEKIREFIGRLRMAIKIKCRNKRRES